MDAFENFFRQADGDGDGKISGAEAVAFFRGCGLPQITLAKIWQLSDQTQRGFLTKPEFIHALKLVTIAQSGRELTPEISRAAFSGPASSQIPPPRVSAPQPQPPQFVRPQAPAPVPAPAPPQYPPQTPPAAAVPQYGQNYTGQPQRPQTPFQQPQTLPPFQHVQQAQPQAQAQAQQQWRPSSRDAFGGSSFQSVPEPPKPESSSSKTPEASAAASSLSSGPSSTPLSADVFGSDAFKASTPSPPTTATRPMLPDDFGAGEEKALVPVTSSVSAPASLSASTAIVPASPPPSAPAQTFRPPGAPGSFPPAHAFTPQGKMPPGPGFTPSFPSVPSAAWPRMSQKDVERYTQVFVGVDSDRDGKIRGDQARDLFLSWRLPRDVLKQIWDLSDQDGDSMLSLREFCIALYFMERYREGRPVPPVLPTGFLPEAPMPQPGFTGAPPSPVVQPQRPAAGLPGGFPGGFPASPQNLIPGMLPGSQSAGLMPMQASPEDTTSAAQALQYKSRVAALELELVNQLSMEDQNTLKAKHQEAEAADRKVFELEKDIKSAAEKIEFYRTKLQEIILVKTRADNQRVEFTERLASDKREVEALRKKYDLKFQQAGEANSRLQAEEVAFRDIQQRKMELYNAIARIDQAKGGELQARAEQISADLNELRALLSQRAKSFGLRAKPSSAMELPFGWQPGIQEKTVDWEDWETFDDDGYSYFHRTEEIKQEPKPAEAASEKPAENPKAKPAEEAAADAANGHLEGKDGIAEERQADAAEGLEKEKSDEQEPEKERQSSETPAAPAPAPSWSSVFGDEPAWNLSQDFGKMGLKSIKTSAPQHPGDASVPETPLFSSGVPETPLFSSSQPETPLFSSSQPETLLQTSSRAGDESLPETPLFKSPDDTRSRNTFARFDSFTDFGHFDDASAAAAGAPGVSTSQTWSTF